VRARKEPEYPADFLAFWAVYPKKVKKPSAYRAWLKAGAKVSNDRLEAVLEAVRLQTQHTWHGKSKTYIPHPASWLNDAQWEDEIIMPELSRDEAIAAMIAEEEEKQRGQT
jgi:hypothetical protein